MIYHPVSSTSFFFRLCHKCLSIHSIHQYSPKGERRPHSESILLLSHAFQRTNAQQPHRSPEHVMSTQINPHPHTLASPLTATGSHALEMACASWNANATTPLGSCLRSAVCTTSGYVPSKNAISRAAGSSAGVSAAICSGGGSGKSSGFLRVTRQ